MIKRRYDIIYNTYKTVGTVDVSLKKTFQIEK